MKRRRFPWILALLLAATLGLASCQDDQSETTGGEIGFTGTLTSLESDYAVVSLDKTVDVGGRPGSPPALTSASRWMRPSSNSWQRTASKLGMRWSVVSSMTQWKQEIPHRSGGGFRPGPVIPPPLL